jgi:methionine synthase II (cobalamin-independent)
MKTPRTSKLPPFFTQAVGAIPRPAVVLDLLARRQEFTVERFGQIMDDFVRYAIRLQGMAGLDVVSDGQWRATDPLAEFHRRVGGFETTHKVNTPAGECPVPVVVRRMVPTGSVYKADAEFLVNNTARLTKFILPSPFELAMTCWHEEHSAGAYPTREAFMAHLVEILNAEVHALVKAGIDMIQVDDGLLTAFCDRRQGLPAFQDSALEALRLGWDADALFPQVVAALNRFAETAGDKAELHLHLGRCSAPRAGEVQANYRPILSRLGGTQVDRVNLGFACGVDLDVLDALPSTMAVGVGVIDVRPGAISSLEVVQSMALAAVERVTPASRVALNPDGGFVAPGGDSISLDEAYERMRRLVLGARELRAQVG